MDLLQWNGKGDRVGCDRERIDSLLNDQRERQTDHVSVPSVLQL